MKAGGWVKLLSNNNNSSARYAVVQEVMEVRLANNTQDDQEIWQKVLYVDEYETLRDKQHTKGLFVLQLKTKRFVLLSEAHKTAAVHKDYRDTTWRVVNLWADGKLVL